jgi:hypothetical protein
MIFFLVITSMIWGITNPFLKHFSLQEVHDEKEFKIRHLLKNWKYLITQVINLTGNLIISLRINIFFGNTFKNE